MKYIQIQWKKVVAGAALLVAVSGCSDYLDQPVTGNLSEEDFYQTEADAQNGLIAAYDAYSNCYNAVWPSVYLIREIPSDDVNAGGSDQNDQAGYQQMDNFIHDASNNQVQGAWGNLWSAVYRANKVVNKTSPDSPAMLQIIAEGKVLRAFMYMDLVTLWGDVPIIKDDVPASEYTSQVRASRSEVLTFIAQDLSEAIPDLPLKNQLGTGNKFRVHKGTAQALLGKAFLYSENWSAAVDAFEEVIGSGQYGLESYPMAPFNKNNKFGKESLFELNYGGDNGGNFPWGQTSDDNIIIQLMGPRGDFYSKASTDSLIGGWGFNTAKAELFNAYVNAGDTYRRQFFIWSQAELQAKGGNWTNAGAWDYEGFLRRKYGSFNNQSGFPGQDPTSDEFNYGTNFVLLRYADVLLMAAEANYRAGNENDARGYLNDVRERAQLSASSASGQALFDAIVLERRLELAFEGHRFADLVRWGLADAELGSLGFVTGKHEVMPIPHADVIAGKLTQNPNY